jgi:hypothetical protein
LVAVSRFLVDSASVLELLFSAKHLSSAAKIVVAWPKITDTAGMACRANSAASGCATG